MWHQLPGPVSSLWNGLFKDFLRWFANRFLSSSTSSSIISSQSSHSHSNHAIYHQNKAKTIQFRPWFRVSAVKDTSACSHTSIQHVDGAQATVGQHTRVLLHQNGEQPKCHESGKVMTSVIQLCPSNLGRWHGHPKWCGLKSQAWGWIVASERASWPGGASNL